MTKKTKANILLLTIEKMKKMIIAAAAVMLAATATASATASAKNNNTTPAGYVDPFIGTGFHGHTYPGATAPFGAVQLSPDTRNRGWDACSGYHHSDSTMIGFSHTHLSGTGCSDLADILFHPTSAEPVLRPTGYIFEPHAFAHANETASPGYYRVLFDNGLKAELTASARAGMHRYTFPAGAEQIIVIDLRHALDNKRSDMVALRQTAANEISGMKRSQGWVRNNYTFFVAQFSREPVGVEYICDGVKVAENNYKSDNVQAIVRFGKSDGTPLLAQVGISKVNEENARENLLHDAPEAFAFDVMRAATHSQWEKDLAKITVEGGTPAQMKTFYTAIYHTRVVPNQMSDANGDYRRHNMSIAKAPEGKTYYSTLSLWDTFRAWNPLMTFTDTALVEDMIWSMLDMYDATGELPIWPLASGETWCMIGYHSVSVIADAWLKGIRSFDGEKALEAMVRSSNINRKGSKYYTHLGYIPADWAGESVSCALEYAYDDWCIAQMAHSLGNEKVYEEYMKRAKNYANVYDPSIAFFRPRLADGSWATPFNTFAVSPAFTEATAWQYRFFTPQDVTGLAELMGGPAKFADALDELFAVSSETEGHQSDITGMIGQYAHGNEPSHHMAYLYNYVGQPWKTQAMTRRILDEQYLATPEGISGNEDCGQMSAWYIFSALGFYPVCPGSNEFALTTPLFPRAVINMDNGRTLEIVANNPAKNIYIARVELNGKVVEGNFISWEQLREGGTLKFVLARRPVQGK
jgi:predicted alpha-1,2-mannosidase